MEVSEIHALLSVLSSLLLFYYGKEGIPPTKKMKPSLCDASDREAHRVHLFQQAKEMGLIPIEILYEREQLSDGTILNKPAYITVRDTLGHTSKRVLGGFHRDVIGTGPLGPMGRNIYPPPFPASTGAPFNITINKGGHIILEDTQTGLQRIEDGYYKIFELPFTDEEMKKLSKELPKK